MYNPDREAQNRHYFVTPITMSALKDDKLVIGSVVGVGLLQFLGIVMLVTGNSRFEGDVEITGSIEVPTLSGAVVATDSVEAGSFAITDTAGAFTGKLLCLRSTGVIGQCGGLAGGTGATTCTTCTAL